MSHYVVKGGDVDKEAAERATSVYLVDRVIPLLPEVLSNDLCSLKPNVDRLAYSVFFEIDEGGRLIDYKIAKTIMGPKTLGDHHLTYVSIVSKIPRSSCSGLPIGSIVEQGSGFC